MSYRSICSFFVLLTALHSLGCAEEPIRYLISIETVADGGGLQRGGGGSVGDRISLCEWKGGWITAERHIEWHGALASRNPDDLRFGSGPDFTKQMRDALKAANLVDFDYGAEIAKARKSAGDFVLVGGSTVRVTVDDGTNHFSFVAVGLGPMLDWYSPFNPRLKGLKDLLDRLRFEYGRNQLMNF